MRHFRHSIFVASLFLIAFFFIILSNSFGQPVFAQQHPCAEKAQTGDYNCDDTSNFNDYEIFQRDFSRGDVPLAPFFEWVRAAIFDRTAPTPDSSTPTQSPSSVPNSPTPSPSTEEALTTHIRSAIAAVQETRIRDYMKQLADDDAIAGEDEKQTRYSGTSGHSTEAEYARNLLESSGLTVTTQEFTVGSTRTYNVIADIPGTDRSKWYYTTAHLDSTSQDPTQVAPGADDNASGSVALIEAARAIKQSGVPLQRSLRFILFSGEEQGLIGSKYYVQNRDRSEKILGVVNMDMIGNKGSPDNCVNFHFYPGSGGNIISETLVDVNNQFSVGLVTQSKSWTLDRSDHGSFWAANIFTAIFGHECTFSPVYHKTTDTMAYISFPQIHRTAQVVAGALVKMSAEGQGEQLDFADGPNDETVLGESVGTASDTATPKATASVAEGTVLATVDFIDLAELDVLTQSAESVIQYIHEQDLPTSVILGLFTKESLAALEAEGYITTIIDEKPNLQQYTFLYHPKHNQSAKLKDQGEVFEIAPRYYLLKVPQGASFEEKGDAVEFFHVPLSEKATLPAPPFRTVRVTVMPGRPLQATEPTPTAVPVRESYRPSPLLIQILIFLIICGGMGFVYYKRKSAVQ